MNMPVNIATDIVLEAAVHPAPLPPVPNASVAGTLQGHKPGVWAHTAKLTRSVTHRGQPLVQQRHDCGPLIPHLTLPVYANPWYAVILPTSSCKVSFGASSVKVDGKAMGMAGIGSRGMLPMMTCGYPSAMPTALPVSTFTNTVNAGMLPRDLLAGCVDVTLKMISDGIIGKFWPSSVIPVGSGASDFLKRAALELFPSPPSKLRKFMAKQALAAATRFTVTLLQKDNPTLQVSHGSALGKVKVKLKVTDQGLDPGYEVRVMGARVKDGKISFLGEELR